MCEEYVLVTYSMSITVSFRSLAQVSTPQQCLLLCTRSKFVYSPWSGKNIALYNMITNSKNIFIILPYSVFNWSNSIWIWWKLFWTHTNSNNTNNNNNNNNNTTTTNNNNNNNNNKKKIITTIISTLWHKNYLYCCYKTDRQTILVFILVDNVPDT